MRNMVLRYVRGISPEKKASMDEKVLASALFRSKKKGYEESVAKPFVRNREGKLDSEAIGSVRFLFLRFQNLQL